MIIIYNDDVVKAKDLIKTLADSPSFPKGTSLQEADSVSKCYLLNDIGIIPVIKENPSCPVERLISDSGVIATLVAIGVKAQFSPRDMNINYFREGSTHLLNFENLSTQKSIEELDSILYKEKHSDFGSFEKLIWSLDDSPVKPGYADACAHSIAYIVQEFDDKRFYLSMNTEAGGFDSDEHTSSTLEELERRLREWYSYSPYKAIEKTEDLELDLKGNNVSEWGNPLHLTSANTIKQLIENIHFINMFRSK